MQSIILAMNHLSEENLRLLRRAPLLSVLVATIISIMKLYSWVYTDSASIMASLMDSLLDLSTSIINYIALRASLAPPDHNHRFGHNKIEDLAVFGQSIGFFASGIFTFYHAAHHIANPKPIEHVEIGISVMIISSILTFGLVAYQSLVIKKTKSPLIEADRLHYFTDLLTNLIIIFSLYFSAKYVILDSLLGILIACYIIQSSYGLFVRATKNLIDEEMNDKERDKIIAIIGKHEEVLGVHELKTRNAGTKTFIQFHLELDGDMSLFDAHEIADRIMDEILKEFPGAEITVHQDPAGLEHNPPYKEKL